MTQDPESQRIADEFHGLLFPPNPRARANMERLWQMVGEAVRLEIAHYRHGIIKDAHGADVEDNGYCNEHYPVLYGRSRLLDRQAGPPADGWVWQEDFDSRLQDDDDTANAEVQYKRAKESLKLQGIRKPTDKQCYAWARKSVETAPPPFKQWRFNIRPGGAWVPPELAGEEPPAILTDKPLQKVALMSAYLRLLLLHDRELTGTGKQLLSDDERYPIELKPSFTPPFVAYHHGPIEWMEGMKRPDVSLEAVKDDLAALAADAAEPDGEPRKAATEMQAATPVLENPNHNNEMTLSEAADKFDVPRPALTKAHNAGQLAVRKVGRNVLVSRQEAKRFADNYNARREQRSVGSLSGPENKATLIAAVEKLGKNTRKNYGR